MKKLKHLITDPIITKTSPETIVIIHNNEIVLHSMEDKVISSSMTSFIKTGIRIRMSSSHYGIFRSVATTFINNSVCVHHTGLLLFPDQYESELMVPLYNEGSEDYFIGKGSPIAVLRIMIGHKTKPILREFSI